MSHLKHKPDSNRATGRSTYMLIAALMAHDRGRAVYVIGNDVGHADMLQSELREIMARLGRDPAEKGISSIKFECESSLGDSFNWESGQMRDANPKCIVFIDHYALESKFSWVLREMHRFDKDAR